MPLDPGRLVFKSFGTVVAVMAAACAAARPPDVVRSGVPPPALVVGEFVDDYGSRYTISAEEWLQHPAISYRIVKWNPEQQYVIAQNAPSNLRSANLWTRIDWMPLSGMPPYEWAFCLSAYEEASPDAAEATAIARRDQPKSGCNGNPFSRMRRVQPGPD